MVFALLVFPVVQPSVLCMTYVLYVTIPAWWVANVILLPCICHCTNRLMKVARERLKHIFKATAFFEGTDSDPRKHEFVKTLLVRECHL